MIQEFLDTIIQTASNGGVIAIVIALCEWVVGFFYRAITDKLGKNR